MYDVVCSLVIYKNERSQLLDAVNSFLNTKLMVKLILVDNSPTNDLKDLIIDSRVEYFFNPSNPGYGTSHNIAIKKYLNNSSFHLVLNPDIYYLPGVLENLILYLHANDDVGLIMPKILYPDNKIQYLAKLLPSPFVFFARRFLPFKKIKEKISDKFELKHLNYDTVFIAPYLSGCFMLFKTETLKIINGFDENIFMHMEDLDISRRCYESGFKTVYYGKEHVFHDHIYKSFLTFNNIKMYFNSAFYYFNKWGWLFDKEREKINKIILNQKKTKP
jgi:GT2 family glycosyltransferase